MPHVKAAPPDPRALVLRLKASAAVAGFREEPFGEIAGCPLLAFTRRAPGAAPRVYLSAGIHGDEPAGTLALLEMIESGVFDRRARWFLCPLLNPAGLAAGIRENQAGVDLNRDYKDAVSPEARAHIGWLRRQPNFDATLCLHEDWESVGFYLYELMPGNGPGVAPGIIAAVRAVCPIDENPVIDGHEAQGGVIRPNGDPGLREQWPESIYLRANHHSRIHATLETPSRLPIATRIAAHRAAVAAALGAL